MKELRAEKPWTLVMNKKKKKKTTTTTQTRPGVTAPTLARIEQTDADPLCRQQAEPPPLFDYDEHGLSAHDEYVTAKKKNPKTGDTINLKGYKVGDRAPDVAKNSGTTKGEQAAWNKVFGGIFGNSWRNCTQVCAHSRCDG